MLSPTATAPASPSPVKPSTQADHGPADAPHFEQVFGHAMGQDAARHNTQAPAASEASGKVSGQAPLHGAGKGPNRSTIKRHADSDVEAVNDRPAAADAGPPAEPASRAASAESHDASENGDEPDRARESGSEDPKVLLGWLQGQVRQGAAGPAATAADSNLTDALADTSKSSGPFTFTASPKRLSSPGDTPPIFVPNTPAGSALSTPVTPADDVHSPAAAFNVQDLGPAANEGATSGAAVTHALTPALSAALAAALSTSTAAAPELVVRGVEQFQALTARVEGSSAVGAPAAAATPTVQALLNAPLATDSPDLPVRLGERLQWLVDSGLQEARLQLHPRELGTVNVHVRIEAKGTSVWFAAEHPAARAALESALPQLRERFANDGVTLAQTQVASQTSGWTFGDAQQQASHQSSAHGRYTSTQSGEPLADNEAEAVSTAGTRGGAGVGLVDRYA